MAEIDSQKQQTEGAIDKNCLLNYQSIETKTATDGRQLKQKQKQKQRQQQQQKHAQRYYIDELGFYRHLDPDQKQYVCSNLNSLADLKTPTLARSVSCGDGGYEICSRAIRNELGISHFDRLVGYELWKRGWDDFMRAKLLKQEPVTLNRELKARVRSGIPHDYRCKVWTALIRMRTKGLRETINGQDIYEIILRDFVSKVSVPEYKVDDDNYGNENGEDDDDDENNNHHNRHRRTYSSIKGDSSFIKTTTTAMQQTITARDDYQSISNTSGKKSTNSNNNGLLSSSTASSSNNLMSTRQINLNESQQMSSPHLTTTFKTPITIGEQNIDKFFKQIELDLLRTLPNNRHFEDPNSRGIKRVRRILRSYACFNPTVGYCQGMNRLAAMALLVLPEEEAFWCLVAIIQCIMPKDYYLKPWLAQVDCCVLGELLEKKMPKLHKHLVKNDIQLTLFSWFFTIFVDGFRPELMLRIWDCFLLEGDKVLFRIALAILNIAQEDLLEMHDFSTMSSHLSRLVSTRKLDIEHLFETAFNGMNPLSSGTLESRREFHRNRMKSMLED